MTGMTYRGDRTRCPLVDKVIITAYSSNGRERIYDVMYVHHAFGHFDAV